MSGKAFLFKPQGLLMGPMPPSQGIKVPTFRKIYNIELPPNNAGARIRIWVGAIFMVPSEQTLERQILARVTFAPELGFIDSG